uniref:NADH-quinone oxidoreductase subunit N n=1 Tax=Desulfobacca acetoxidans TaxID=60893 RepID=A0A7C3Z830_9BACT
MPYDLTAISPQLILSGGCLLIFCAGAFWRPRPEGLLFSLAVLAVVGAGSAILVGLPAAAPAFQGLLALSSYSRLFSCLFLGITLMTLLFGRQYGTTRGFAGDELYGLLLLAALGMLLIAGSVNWVIFFLGLELLSLSLYILIAIEKGNAAANEAGLKYFLMGAVASAFLTFGIALLYAQGGTLEIRPSLAAVTPAGIPWLLAGLAFILVGFGFKISMAPFHLWTPDVYQGAPAPVTAFLSTGSKIALFVALTRLAVLLGEPAWSYCQPVLWGLAVLTMAVGNITALYQTRIKRLLAYSSIGQMGYLLMGLTAVKQGALEALIFFLVVYAVMDLGAFGLVGVLSGEREDLDDLEGFQGLGYDRPWSAATLAVCLLALAGLPPTAGFMGKFILFRAVLKGGFVVLAVIGIITVIISIYVYLKVLVALYMQPAARPATLPRTGLAAGLATAAILILIFWLGLQPVPLLTLISRIAGALTLI